MATSSFFYGGSTAPEQNTVDQLIDALNQQVAAADEDRVAAELAKDQAIEAAANALLSEQNTGELAQQAQILFTEAEDSVVASAASATASASSAVAAATNAAASATNASLSAASALESANNASESESIASAAASNPYVVAVGSDLAGSGWTYDLGLVTDPANPLGYGTSPGYIETVAENIDDVTTVATNIGTIGDAVTAAADAAASASAAASSQAAAATSATNAASSATAAAGSASTSSTQATNAANSATAAAGSASAASTSATNAASSASAASSSATAAAGSATAASGSASAAASSATAAQAAQAAAEAAYDNFDDRYLGAKVSAPSTDNDGNALVTGALYFNSTLGQMFAWSGTAWGVIGSNLDAVLGPASSTDNAIARFDGTTGKLVQNSTATLSDTGDLTVTKLNFDGAYGYGFIDKASNTVVRFNSGAGGHKLLIGGQDGDDMFVVHTDGYFGLNNGGLVYSAASADIRLYRDAANTLAQRNGTNPQTFRVYNTYTDGSNYERGSVAWVSNRLEITTEHAGTGSAKPIRVSSPSSYAVLASSSSGVYIETNLTNRAQFADGGLQFRSDYQAKWSSDAAVDGTMDTGLARDSAGVVKVTNGSNGLGVLKASSLDIDTFDLGVLP